MTSLRLQNDPSLDQEDLQAQLSDPDSSSQVRHGKASGRPGRPKGKGRPKRSSKLISKKKSEEEEEWQQRVKVRERPIPNKQQSSVEGYVKIIDYLKKIDYDQCSVQNKMNPYNALTATCFWYAISAEYYSFDFFSKKHPHDYCMEILDKVHRIPLSLPNRVTKIPINPSLLCFQTPQLNILGKELSDKISSLVPAPLSSRPQVSQRKICLSTVAQDDQFISSTRAMVYNYISNKIKNSDKWSTIFTSFSKQVEQLPPKQFEIVEPVELQKEQEEYKETNLFQLLRQQAKKKVQKKQKKKQADPNEIYEQEDKKQQEIFKEEEEQMKQKSQHNQIKNQQQEMAQDDNQMEIEQKQEEPIIQQKQTYHKVYNQQDLLLDCILQLPIDKIISILQSSLPTAQLPQIQQPTMPIPTTDPLQFVYQLHPEEQNYLEYMKEYRKKIYRQKVARSQIIDEEDRQDQYQDAKCQICTDGDYTDDNLIVFCSMCNISLHQRCVGLAKVPAESWVCDLCLSFGPSGINLPCPLCNVKGGAMKRTTIHIDTNIFKQTNPGYYQYSKKCPYNKLKQQYVPKQKIQGEEDNNLDGIVRVVRQRGQKQEECYYDYFVKSTYPTQIPTCHYVWVHYVCAIWVPQCYFQQKNGVISVKGIENIQKKRFKYECFVCKKNKCGAAVKCEDYQCDKYYHPECARKKKVYMEQLNLQKLKYLIFCQQHEPLKLTRQIQYKKKKNRQQIIKFARMIEKYIDTYRIAQFPFKLLKSAIPSTFIQTIARPERQEHKDKRTLSGSSDQEFLKDLMAKLSKAKMMTVHLEKVENGFKITNVQTPSKREIRKCLNRYDQFWNTIKNGQSNEENFKRYERIILDNQKLRQKLQIFLNGTLSVRPKQQQKKQKKVGKKRGKHAVQPVQTLIEEEGGIFCVCKKPYEGQTDMFECQVCGEWYHFKCLGFIGTEEDLQTMQFSCMKCMKFEDQSKKEERLTKYSKFFSPDSILYNYRPATPELMSEEQIELKNYTEIIQEAKKSKQLHTSPHKNNQNQQLKRQQQVKVTLTLNDQAIIQPEIQKNENQ